MADEKENQNHTILIIEGSQTKVETELERTYAKEEYLHVFQVIHEIIQTAERDRQRRKAGKDNNQYTPDIRIHNIVPIIGERGAGKSTMMHTVAHLLRDQNRGIKNVQKDRKDKSFELFFGENGVFREKRFTVLDSIDGSLLEPSEDIFQTVLAQIYELLQDYAERTQSSFYRTRSAYEENNKDISTLYTRLGKLMESAKLMEESAHGRFRRSEEPPLVSLKQISGSIKMQRDFQGLLDCVLQYCSRDGKYEDHYLVVLIDDLDLNIEHGYEMLEQIHRYLMVPNVIILMAFDEDQFCRLTENHFYDMVPKFDSRMNAAAERIHKLARQYLEKVMPLDSRTYIPNLTARSDIYVRFGKGLKETDGLPQKAFVFNLIATKLGIRLDTGGGKRHFFEQESLRTYVNFALLLQGMKQLQKTNPDNIDVAAMRNNYRVLEQEIINHMAARKLSDRNYTTYYRMDEAATTLANYSTATPTKRLFEMLTANRDPLPASLRLLFSEIVKEAEREYIEYVQLGLRVEEVYSLLSYGRFHDLYRQLRYYGYSYGEVLHIIYVYGRLSNERKALIHCLLAYYSLVLTRSYLIMRYEKKQETIKKEKANLCAAMNASVAGSWANRMVPKVRVPGNSLGMESYQSGIRIDVKVGDVFRINGSKIEELIASETGSRSITDFIKAVLLLGMFFDQPTYKRFVESCWKSDFSRETKNNSEDQFALKDYIKMLSRESEDDREQGAVKEIEDFIPAKENVNAVFSFLSFVSNAFQSIQEDKVELPLLDYTVSYLHAEFPERHRSILKAESSIRNEFVEWGKEFGALALPIYDIDVCYNVLKRLRQDAYGNMEIVSHDKLWDEFIKAYYGIAQRLAENDKTYQDVCKVELGSDALTGSFETAFCSCPYMKWLGISGGNFKAQKKDILPETAMDWLKEQFKEMFVRLTSGEKSKALDDEKKTPMGLSGYDD